MLKIDKISKSVKKTQILQDISFEVEAGEFIAVMGASGSGKSTLLYSISGMDSISQGRVLFDGADMSQMDEAALSELRLNKMGFVFQQAQMLKNLTIFDNITLPGLVANKEPAHKIRKRATSLMKQMDLQGLEARDIKEVSGGQLQRVSICRAMINQPAILFLDEPTGALNSTAADQVLAILGDLNRQGITIMMVTHDPRVAAKARKIIYIRDGQIAASKDLTSATDSELELGEWLKSLHASA